MTKQKTILVLSPHTDDAEIGAGGSIARFVEEGHLVLMYAFSTGHPSRGASREEFLKAAEVLNIASCKILGGDSLFRTRRFFTQRDKILDALVEIRKQHEPDIVLIPSRADAHQDHQVIMAEAMRAFKQCTILGYEMPANNAFCPPRLNYFVRLEEQHILQKVAAVNCYESQIGRGGAQEQLIWALARIRGLQAGAEFAEAFEALKVIE